MEISGKYHISSSPGVRDVVSAFQVMGSSSWWEARGETLWTFIVNRSCRLIRPGQCLIQASCNSRIGQPLNLYPSSNNCNMEEFLTIVTTRGADYKRIGAIVQSHSEWCTLCGMHMLLEANWVTSMKARIPVCTNRICEIWKYHTMNPPNGSFPPEAWDTRLPP
jgi:hypothetical protein